MDDQNLQTTKALLELSYAAGDHPTLRRYSADPAIDPRVRQYASGLLMRRWLPWDARRQLMMFVLAVAFIVSAFVFRNAWLLLFLAIPLSFSPRVVAEALLLLGRAARAE